MAKLGQAQEQTMDEILASIRRIIQDEDVRKSGLQAAAARANAVPAQPMANISRLFAEEVPVPEPGDSAETATSIQREEDDNVVELAIAQAIEAARVEVEGDATETEAETVAAEPEPAPRAPAFPPRSRAVDEAAAAPVRPVPPADRPLGQQTLLSPRSDAAVSAAFNQLASNMLSGSARTIDDLVEDMLRPMLRNWLDMNLPPLVERLVREEIERVSRGRR